MPLRFIPHHRHGPYNGTRAPSVAAPPTHQSRRLFWERSRRQTAPKAPPGALARLAARTLPGARFPEARQYLGVDAERGAGMDDPVWSPRGPVIAATRTVLHGRPRSKGSGVPAKSRWPKACASERISSRFPPLTRSHMWHHSSTEHASFPDRFVCHARSHMLSPMWHAAVGRPDWSTAGSLAHSAQT